MKKRYLITPGPTPIPPEVSSQEGLPVLHHRTAEFQKVFAEVVDGLKYVYQTQNDVLGEVMHALSDHRRTVVPDAFVDELVDERKLLIGESRRHRCHTFIIRNVERRPSPQPVAPDPW